MNSKQCRDMLATLRQRYDIDLDTHGWESQQVDGGAALRDELSIALSSAARRFDDTVAVVYEMESSGKEFEPMTVSLNEDGFRALRQSLLSHFDLVMVPTSRKWAFLMSHELDGIVCGPGPFLAAFADLVMPVRRV